METFELADLTLTEIPPDKVLYNEVLCEKINSRFKKVKVMLKRCSSIDGTPVYNFELSGKNQKNHLAFDFDAKNLCFMRCEEKQENVHEPSCFSCMNRNFYPNIIYTRLIMIWYSMNHSAGEASCIKVPLLQQGNAYAATALKRLESIIYSQVVGADQLKHWMVLVLQCGALSHGSRIFLGLTKFALVLLHDYNIIAYHDLLENDFGICLEEGNILHLAVTSKVQNEEDCLHSNFSLSTTYVFQTPDARFIEASLQSLQKHSETQSSVPLPHFNIHHRETSASGIIPGTTSDNFSIIPHHTNPAFVDDSSGSHSNGHIPNEPRTFSDSVIIHPHPAPPPHFQGMSSSGSNGTIPGSDSATFVKQTNLTTKAVINQNELLRVEMNNNNLVTRGSSQDPKIMNVTLSNAIKAERPQTLGRSLNIEQDNHETQVKQCPSPPRSHSSLTPAKELCDSSPINTTAYNTWKKSRLSVDEADLLHQADFDLDFVEFDFENDNDIDLSLQPLPKPCGNTAHPLQEFRYKPPLPIPKSDQLTSPTENGKYIHPLPPRKPKPTLIRARSLDFFEELNHSYVNVELQSVQMRNALDDTPYFRFYYNYGFVRMMAARMSKKIERRSRISSHIEDVDFNLLDKHEQWFDGCYKSRDKDLKFLRLSKMNIPPSLSPSAAGQSPYSRAKPDEPMPDDPYWSSSELPFTIQAILQDHAHGVRDFFDLTQEQMMELQVRLSLVPAQKDWKNLAEYIGLVSEDISVIEHFCYTYKHLTSEIVLAHWVLQQKMGKQMNQPCNRENLLRFLEEAGRSDILSHIKASLRENEQIQTRKDMNEIMNVIETTRL